MHAGFRNFFQKTGSRHDQNEGDFHNKWLLQVFLRLNDTRKAQSNSSHLCIFCLIKLGNLFSTEEI